MIPTNFWYFLEEDQMKTGQESQHIDMFEKTLGFTVCQHINMFSWIPTVNGTYFEETHALHKKVRKSILPHGWGYRDQMGTPPTYNLTGRPHSILYCMFCSLSHEKIGHPYIEADTQPNLILIAQSYITGYIVLHWAINIKFGWVSASI